MRKRTGVLAFTEEVAAMPHSEIIKQMSSNQAETAGPESRTWPRAYTGQVEHLRKLLRGVKSMPAGKAPGLDGVTAEILKLGGQALMLVMFPIYRAASMHSCVPSDWNDVALQLMWKTKGRRDDIEKYRPIALTSIPER